MANFKWVVNVKGTYECDNFEISVLRDDNTHGKRSYGWIDENKLLISHDGGPCHFKVTEKVWNKLIKIAQETADELNAEEESITHEPQKEYISPPIDKTSLSNQSFFDILFANQINGYKG